MPRIQYANPTLDISVVKKPKTKEENWNPEMLLTLRAFKVVLRELDSIFM